MELKNLSFLDVETTGGQLGIDRVIEIGIIRVENNKVVKEFKSLINPEKYLSPYIEQMTGISNEDLESSLTFDELAEEIHALLSDSVLVAHNARFDYGFMKYEFKNVNISFSADCLCTVKLSRLLYPQHRRHDLSSVISRFNFACENRHRAFDDAHVLWQFYQHVTENFSTDLLDPALEMVLKTPRVPSHLNKSIIEALPEQPGIYIFLDENKTPIYVGKSKNIKTRVLSHFTDTLDSHKEMEMAAQIRDIQFQTTAGELGALLLESRLVKELQPYYNHSLKKCIEVAVITCGKSKAGYCTPSIEMINPSDCHNFSDILGTFKNKQSAKRFLSSIIKSHSLCEKLMGLDSSKQACFSHKLGICHGACVEKEPVEEYNKRFLDAFQKTKVREWPFNGPVLFEEKNKLEREVEGFVFDNWKLIAALKYDETQDVNSKTHDGYFDLDVYRILRNYINPNTKYRLLTQAEVSQMTASDI